MPPFTAATSPALAVSPRRVENGKGLMLMALGMFLFSAVDTQAKYLTTSFHPIQIVWIRQLGLLAGAGVLFAMNGHALFRTGHPFLQVARGALAATSATLFIVAISFVPLADAVAISFVAPFVVTVLGALVLREPVGLRRWLAVAGGFFGMLVVIRPGMGVLHPASLLVVVAATAFALRQIISRALSDTDRTITTVAYTAVVGSAILTIPLPLLWVAPSGGTEIALCFGIAILAAAAEICVIKALEIAHAVVVAPMQYTLIIWGTFYGWMVFGQLPDGWTWAGTAIIIATGLYTLHRERLAKRRAVAAGPD